MSASVSPTNSNTRMTTNPRPRQTRRSDTTTRIIVVKAFLCSASILILQNDMNTNTNSPHPTVSAFSGPQLHQRRLVRHPFVPNTNPQPRLTTPYYNGCSQRRAASPNANNDDTNDELSPPLFDIDLIESASVDSSSFRVKDMSSFQTMGDEPNQPDEDDSTDNDDKEDNQFYNDALSPDDEDLYSDGIDLTDATTTNDNTDGDEIVLDYERDQDDILTEREDRLYIDDAGRRVKVETCVLVGVEELSAMRKDRRKQQRLLLAPASSSGGSSGDVQKELDVYFSLEESMTEMRDLIKTSGLELVGEITQRLNEVNPKTYIGTGKVAETQDLLAKLDSCTVVFDAELSPGQQKALENAFNKEIIQNDFLGADQIGDIKVIDRTALILDIFAQHAKTREGKLQVDLALHEYRKPRLTKMWTHLERQSGAGGVGLRGPGESQLEIDRRLLRDRIIVLKRKIDSVQTHRDMHRKGRERMGLPVLAIVGYTNAGKSTLLNYLTRSGVLVEDILFATLDPTTRKVKLPGLKTHPEVLLTDTVGFIQKLPTQLVAAFRATLEEVREADVLVHVMDVNNPVWQKQEVAVMQVLEEIEAGGKPIVRVFNKIDALEGEGVMEDIQLEAAMMPGHTVAISALTGEGMVDFVTTVEEALMGLLIPVEVLIPYTNGKEVNMIQEVGHVENIEYREDGTYLQARVPESIANRLVSFNVGDSGEQQQYGREKTDNSKNSNASLEVEEEIDWTAIGRGRHPKNTT